MQVNSRAAAWMQGLALTALVMAIIAVLLYRMRRPLDRDTLDIEVEALHSQAAEASLLAQHASANQLATGFVAQHAGQLAENAGRATDALDDKQAEPALEPLRLHAAQLGGELQGRLQAIAGDGSLPRTDHFAFDALADRFDALHRQLKPGD